jgi:hypothetical protein
MTVSDRDAALDDLGRAIEDVEQALRSRGVKTPMHVVFEHDGDQHRLWYCLDSGGDGWRLFVATGEKYTRIVRAPYRLRIAAANELPRLWQYLQELAATETGEILGTAHATRNLAHLIRTGEAP